MTERVHKKPLGYANVTVETRNVHALGAASGLVLPSRLRKVWPPGVVCENLSGNAESGRQVLKCL
jgi:hypothetical protein